MNYESQEEFNHYECGEETSIGERDMNKTTSHNQFTTPQQNSTLKDTFADCKSSHDVHLSLSLIRDREDCPEDIVEMIDDIRYSEFFNSINDNDEEYKINQEIHDGLEEQFTMERGEHTTYKEIKELNKRTQKELNKADNEWMLSQIDTTPQWEKDFYERFNYIQVIKNDQGANSYNRIIDFIKETIKEEQFAMERGEMIKNPCKYCYGKGYSTELKGDEFCMADFIGDKTYRTRIGGVRVKICSCGRGRDLKLMFNVKEEYER